MNNKKRRHLRKKEQLEAVNTLKEIAIKYRQDPEVQHQEGDDVLRDVLLTMGYDDIVEEYDKLEKYYL